MIHHLQACGGASIGHRLPNLLESGLNCLKTGLHTPGPSKLCFEVSFYLLRVLPSPGARFPASLCLWEAPYLFLGAVHSMALEVQAARHLPWVVSKRNAVRTEWWGQGNSSLFRDSPGLISTLCLPSETPPRGQMSETPPRGRCLPCMGLCMSSFISALGLVGLVRCLVGCSTGAIPAC